MNSVVLTCYTIFTKKIFFIFLFFSTLFSQDQLGDLNQDGTVDVIDIVRLVNIILETPPEPTTIEINQADVNFDEEVNVIDVVSIVDAILTNTAICITEECNCFTDQSKCCLCDDYFIWEPTILSNHSGIGGIAYQVKVFSDDNVWVVGDMVLEGLNGRQNLVKWDGHNWTFDQILTTVIYYGYNEIVTDAAITSIFAISENDIYMKTNLGSLIHWDGVTYTDSHTNWEHPSCNADIWGYNEGLFFACEDGGILHLNAENYQIMDAGIPHQPYTSDVRNIFGLESTHIWASLREWAAVSNNYPTGIASYNGDSWELIYESINSNENSFYDVWAHEDTVYIPSRAGLIKESISTGDSVLVSNSNGYDNLVSWGMAFIDGYDYENIAVLKYDGAMLLYNNGFWHYLDTITNYEGLKMFYQVDYQDDRITIVGSIGNAPSQAIIIRGYRYGN